MTSSHFANSHNVVYDNTFVTANNYNVHSGGTPGSDKAFDRLYDNTADEAIHNSDERCEAPKVYPETRKVVQEEIFAWITNGDDEEEPRKIMWISGPAGAGKTAIAGSIAELCDEEGLLAGSFFFSSFAGSEKRRSKRWVMATLVYSLLKHPGLQALRKSILSIIEHDPGIFRKRLRDQCKAFLLQPLYDVRGQLNLSALPKVIILDGLDEVEAANSRNRDVDEYESRLANEADQTEILSALLQAAHDADFPFRILVVSRPERVIRDFFSTKGYTVTKQIFLDNKYNPDADIALFLKAKFAEIRRRYNLDPRWPGEHDIEKLVDAASGQFIYAATLARFLQSGRHPDPQALLRTILDWRHRDSLVDALAPLDALYNRIIRSSPDPLLATRWLGFIDAHLSELKMSALFTRQFLQDFEGQADYLLENLASLVHMPRDEAHRSDPCHLYHKSLADYLRSSRCGADLRVAFTDKLQTHFNNRVGKVLRARSAVIPLTQPQLQDFRREFLYLLDAIYISDPDQSVVQDLAACDVVWWVRLIVTNIVSTEPGFAARILGSLFSDVHVLCPRCNGTASKVASRGANTGGVTSSGLAKH